MEQYSIIGRRMLRKDAREKITGKAVYGFDVNMPGMLYGKILRSPLPHAKILKMDVSKAERLPGVKAVITAEGTPKIKYGAVIQDRFFLALDKVRYIGEEVAAVAAENEHIAEEALDLIEVEYEELPAVFDPEEALNSNAPQIHEGRGNIAAHHKIFRGDIEKGFRESHHIFEDSFCTSSVTHCCIETHPCVANMDATGKITLWASVASPFQVRQTLSRVLNMPEAKLRIIQPFIGGAFGGKVEMKPIHPICALLAKKTGRPVKMVNSREEEFATTNPRVPSIVKLKTGVKKDGTIVAKQAEIITDGGAYTGLGPAILDVITIRMDNIYRFSNIKTEAKLVYTNKVPVGPFRGFGNPQRAFAVESQMDMIAEKLGMDPMEIRLKNAVQAGDITAHGWKIHSCGLSECIRQSAQLARWQEKRTNKSPKRGIGMACGIHVSGNRPAFNYDGSTALIKVNLDGTFHLVTGETEIGQGAATTLAQIAAEELGVSLEDIEVVPVDTDFSPFCLGSFADRVTTIGGKAVQLAASDAKGQLFHTAAEALEVSDTDLESKDRRIYVKGSPERGMSISEVARIGLYRGGGAPVIGKASYDPDTVVPDPKTLYGNSSSDYAFVCQVAEVEVDTETGQVTVLNFVAAHDLGKAINPMTAEGQIQGALVQGLGFALTEKLVNDAGKIVNPNFLEYNILYALDIPKIKPILIETQNPTGPFGAKGLGEPALVPTAPAIANAIYDAVGVRIKELPITPEKVLKALKDGSL